MNLKSKLLMIASVVGISTVSASEFQTNPEETLTISEESKRKLVLEVCKNPGVPDYLINQFIPAFSSFLEVNSQTWGDVSEPQLTHYIDHFLRYGGF